MGEHDDTRKSSSSGSPSASASPSQGAAPLSGDDLDEASVQRLAAELHGLRQDHADLRELVRSESKKGLFQGQAAANAIEKHTAAIERLSVRIERALKLNRHVGHEIAEGVVKVVKEETGKHLLPRPESDEITGRQWRYLLTHKVGPWLAAHDFFVKLFAGLAAAAGAAWAYLTHKH